MKEKPSALDLLLLLILACCIVRLWIMPLGSSLWVDEMGTYFVVHRGANDPSLQIAPQVAASIYYVLPKVAEKIAGFSEVSYRFFSLLAMVGASGSHVADRSAPDSSTGIVVCSLRLHDIAGIQLPGG